VDTSHFRRFQQLFTSYPDARFVLTTRLDEEWTERLASQKYDDIPKDMPTPNQYLSEVLRFFVNNHATHRLMVCNIFTESDELLWSKLKGFLQQEQKLDLVGQAFPRVVAEVDGRLSKAVKVQKSPGKDLIKDFAVSVQGTQTPPTTEAKSSQDSASEADEQPEQIADNAQAKRVLGNYIDYQKTYKAKYVVRPDNAECVRVPVIFNKRITPPDYDRNIIHISFRVEGAGELATYEAGDCISIFPQNKQELVDDFLSKMDGMDPSYSN
jgi:hypothetical protein